MKNIDRELTEKLKKSDPVSILKTTDNSTYYYALSEDRGNCFEFFPFTDKMTVLLDGACYGAYCELSERVKRFDIYDRDEAALMTAACRYPGLLCENGGNIRLMTSLSGLEYDVIILPLMHRTADGSAPGLKAAVTEACRFLKDGGTLLLAADNSGALCFMSGTEPERDVLYTDPAGLRNVASAAGFSDIRLYYPLPSADFAKNIFSETRLPGKGDFRGISQSFDPGRLTLINEETAYAALSESGVFEDFAPSFVAVLSGFLRPDMKGERRTGAAIMPGSSLPEYIRYNSSRRPEFALKTEIYNDNGTRRVRKTALKPEANAHIEGFMTRYALLTGGSGDDFTVLRPVIGKTPQGTSYAEFEYISGTTLDKELISHVKNGRLQMSRLREAIEIAIGNPAKVCHNLDAVFDNIILSEGRYYLMDYEWVFPEELDRDFLIYRILRYFYENYEKELYGYRDVCDFLKEWGYEGPLLKELVNKEDSFQSYVSGSDKARIESKFRQPERDVRTIRNAVEKQEYYSERMKRLNDELNEHKTALKKEREVARLSQNHIHNLENIISVQKQQLENSEKQLAFMHRFMSIPGRVYLRFISWLDERAPQGSSARKTVKYVKSAVLHPVRTGRLFLTDSGRQLVRGNYEIGGEFEEGGILEIPYTGEPLVSVVIPVYNQVGYTYACIRSILENTDLDKTPLEIILADDVSTDATDHIGEYIKGLVINRNTENQGFLLNCNKAAALARGRYIFFLNNDTKVREGWLSSVVGLMEDDPGIGMAGSKLIYPDGRLQEAGGIIWSDGSGWNYGRMDDPGKPEYNYVKDVDYISGAAIMIRKTLWDDIGGFDSRFAPAYCEDSDLAFEVRKKGFRVVYQPRSEVVHYEGISNGTDVEGSGLKRYQLVNQEKFRDKWKEELLRQSVNTGSPDPFEARDRSQGKPVVLVIDHYVPRWDRDAGSRTTYQYIKLFLSKGFNVKFIGDNFEHEEPYAGILEQMGVEILSGDAYRADIFDWISKHRAFIDIAYLNRPHITSKYIDFLKTETNIKCIYYGHDLHYLRLSREYELDRKEETGKDAAYWHSLEFSVMEQADRVYYPSAAEADAILAENPDIPVRPITAYMWDSFPDASGMTEDGREGLLFVGGFAHAPNADGILWFADRILPLIKEKHPDVRLYIAGSNVTDEVKAIGNDSIRILGFVSDEELSRLYAATSVTVVPLRYGAGVKGKVVEALYNGCAVVTTETGAEGIPDAGNAMLIADAGDADTEEKSFAEKVIRLLDMPEEREKLRKNGLELVRRYYSADAAWNEIKDDFLVSGEQEI